VNPLAPKQLMLRLFDKLANDDLFRSRFERNPKEGLIAVGFSAEEAQNFPAEQLGPNVLASKESFAAERRRVQEDLAAAYACMVIPALTITSRLGSRITHEGASRRAA